MLLNADVDIFVSYDFTIVFDAARDGNRNHVLPVKDLSNLITENSFQSRLASFAYHTYSREEWLHSFNR